MRNTRFHQEHQGQALVELMILLPVILIFLAAAVPLITKSKVLPWLDERLTLRHILLNEEQIQSLLSHTHEPDLLPRYFDKNALEETTQNLHGNKPSTISFITFPGDMSKQVTTLTYSEDDQWNLAISRKGRDEDKKISRSLAMVTLTAMEELQAVERVKQLAIVGSASATSDVLGKAGINLFHIDLNALPESGEGG